MWGQVQVVVTVVVPVEVTVDMAVVLVRICIPAWWGTELQPLSLVVGSKSCLNSASLKKNHTPSQPSFVVSSCAFDYSQACP